MEIFFTNIPMQPSLWHKQKTHAPKQKSKLLTPKIQKGKIMRTVLFAYYLNNERKHEALYTEQRLDFMRSYKIRKWRKTVSDVEGCLV